MFDGRRSSNHHQFPGFPLPGYSDVHLNPVAHVCPFGLGNRDSGSAFGHADRDLNWCPVGHAHLNHAACANTHADKRRAAAHLYADAEANTNVHAHPHAHPDGLVHADGDQHADAQPHFHANENAHALAYADDLSNADPHRQPDAAQHQHPNHHANAHADQDAYGHAHWSNAHGDDDAHSNRHADA